MLFNRVLKVDRIVLDGKDRYSSYLGNNVYIKIAGRKYRIGTNVSRLICTDKESNIPFCKAHYPDKCHLCREIGFSKFILPVNKYSIHLQPRIELYKKIRKNNKYKLLVDGKHPEIYSSWFYRKYRVMFPARGFSLFN